MREVAEVDAPSLRTVALRAPWGLLSTVLAVVFVALLFLMYQVTEEQVTRLQEDVATSTDAEVDAEKAAATAEQETRRAVRDREHAESALALANWKLLRAGRQPVDPDAVPPPTLLDVRLVNYYRGARRG